MIKGKDKPFVKGKVFQFPKYEKGNSISKGKRCTYCLIYKKNKYFDKGSSKCIKCK